MRQSAKEAFAALSELYGGVEILERAKAIAPNAKAAAAVCRLEAIYEVLKLYGVEKYINFDFSMSGIYGYYTGIIFRGYTFGTGDAVVKGGRYDHLLEKFGKHSPSIGFAIVVDELMNALTRQKIEIQCSGENTILLYDAAKQKDAIEKAGEFRSKDISTELVKRDPDRPLADYIEYGRKYYAETMLYLEEDGRLTVVDLLNNKQKIMNP